MGKNLCLQLYTHKETQKEKCERKQGNSERGCVRRRVKNRHLKKWGNLEQEGVRRNACADLLWGGGMKGI